MVSQRAVEILSVEPAEASRLRATLRLACGCVVTREVAGDRIQEIEGGGKLAVGKYPCPEGHAVVRE